MKTKKSHKFFSEQEREEISKAVAVAEAGTSGEIATMVVDHSDSYREAETLGALLMSGLLSVIIAVVIHHVTIWSYIPLVTLLYFPVLFVFKRFPHLKLPFVGRRRITEAVRERAVRAFYEKGLYRTRDETGILIFISILERKVWILGDRGINAKIDPNYWQRFAGELAQGIRDNHAGKCLCRVIEECGMELARHFPRRPDDTNELSNDVLS